MPDYLPEKLEKDLAEADPLEETSARDASFQNCPRSQTAKTVSSAVQSNHVSSYAALV